ncbi:hypothetical protein LX16_1159 [Stackebrandtia albiflava]|uniref:Uncharacterized protein n=1 Tax=Stackebrandtia albiflava TaxID=406432 RepID=A0A562VC45_9ACTN|nr:hypothetical protein [Stackebrandtia albiflava]TWJ15449.1 hypothetical protein LX16_1159 [Stackebrandtia albiflava]
MAMKKPGRKQVATLTAVPYETFAEALGKPVDAVEVRKVIAALGGGYEVRPIEYTAARYDPDVARTLAWDFPAAPPANGYVATHLGVRDDTVVWMTLAPALVEGVNGDRAVSLRLPDDDEPVFRPQGPEWNWAPGIIRRGTAYLLDLDVGQGHWDGNYRFPLTPRQAEQLQADLLLYRQLWDGLVRVCQSARFLEDPSTLPGDAQSVIDARCGRD